MIKISWNEFVIGCGIPLGGAVLASLFFSGNSKKEVISKKQIPKDQQETYDAYPDKQILNNDLEDFNDDYLKYPEDQGIIINNAAIKND